MPGPSKVKEPAAPLEIPSAPVFHPSPEEFKNPLAYIASIRPKAEQFGLCKIVPPDGWKPPFAIDKSKFTFKTRIQGVHELQEKENSQQYSRTFHEEYEAFLKAQGKSYKRNPSSNNQEVDLCRLYKAVQRRGGFDAVCNEKSWRDVARVLQVRDRTGNAPSNLRQLYQKYLLAFERSFKEPQQFGNKVLKEKGGSHANGQGAEITDTAEAQEAAEILETMLGLQRGVVEDRPKKKRKTDKKATQSEGKGSVEVEEQTADVPKTEQDGAVGVRIPANIDVLVCEICQGGHQEENIILCDKCDKGCHMFCLSPPLEEVPEGDWFCPFCLAIDSETYAFKDGGEFTLEEYGRKAVEFKNKYFGGESKAKKVTWKELETEFWRLVEGAEEPVDVMYGADLDTGVLGSGFPRRDTSKDKFVSEPWNLNNFPKLDGEHASLLRQLEENITGVMVPWLYVGMMFSSFCWHVEDHMFYSINYHHWGEPKKWYGVPAEATASFEAAFKKALPQYFVAQPDLLFHLVTMLSPRVLQQAGVPIFETVQEQGNFIVTFPGAYHSGFNFGLNCAEAVNFAPADWLRYGFQSIARYKKYRKHSVFAHDKLVLKVAQLDTSLVTSSWSKLELERLLAEEKNLRYKLWSEGVKSSRRITGDLGVKPEDKDDSECSVCRTFLYSSALECSCSTTRAVCLGCSGNLCECGNDSRKLLYRHPLGELEELLQKVSQRVEAFQQPPEDGSAAPKTESIVAEHEAKLFRVEPAEKLVEWVTGLNERSNQWANKAEERLSKGNVRVSEVDALLLEGQEFLWVGQDRVSEIEKKLRAARTWAKQVNVYNKTKPTLADLESVVHWEPPPVSTTCFSRLKEAYKTGKTWLERAAPMLSNECSVDLKSLEDLIVEGYKIRVVLQELPQLETRVLNGRRLAASIQKVLPLQDGETLKDKPGFDLDFLQSLKSQSGQLKLNLPEIERLDAALENIHTWQGEAKQVVNNKPTISELEALLSKASTLPAFVPETELVKVLIEKATNWKHLVVRATTSGAPLKKLRDLELVGQRLPVALDLEQLSTDISRREWEEASDKLLTTKVSVQTIKDSLADASATAVEGSQLAQKLRERMEAAEAWTAKAQKVLEQVAAMVATPLPTVPAPAALPAPTPPTSQSAATHAAPELATDADDTVVHNLIVRMFKNVLVANGEAAMEAALTDVSTAPAADQSGPAGEQQQMEVDVAPPAVETGDGQEVETPLEHAPEPEPEAMAVDGPEDAPAAEAVEAEPVACPNVSELELLIAEGGTLNMELDQLGQLSEIVQKVHDFRKEAEPVLAACSNSKSYTQRASLEQLEMLLQKAHGLGVKVPEMATVKEKLQQAVDWKHRAARILEDQVAGSDTAQLQELLKDGHSVGLKLTELHRIDQQLQALQWNHQVKMVFGAVLEQFGVSGAALSAQTAGDGLAERLETRVGKRRKRGEDAEPSVELAKQMLSEVQPSAVNEQLVSALHKLIAAANEWEEKASNLMSGRRGMSADGSAVTLEQLTAVAEEGAALGIVLEGMPQVQEAITRQRAIEEELQRLVNKGGERPTLDGAQKLMQQSSGAVVGCQSLDAVAEMVNKAEEWQERCRKQIVKRGSTLKLDKVLSIIHASIDNALQQLTRRLHAHNVEGESSVRGDGGAKRRRMAVGHREDEQELFCVCQQPYHVDTAMINCDLCEEWFHMKCVGLTQSQAKNMKKYVCPVCTALKGNLDLLDAAVQKVQKTRRPELSVLQTLLEEAAELGCQVPEEVQLAAINETFGKWMTAVDQCMHQHDVSQQAPTGPVAPKRGKALTERLQHQLLKSALSLEVNCAEVVDRVMDMMKADRWRSKVEAAIKSNTKHNLDGLIKLSKEAEMLGITADKDRIGIQITKKINSARQWVDKSRQLVNELKGTGSEEQTKARLQRAEQLVKSADLLQVRVDKEMEALKEASKLYCLCRQPYNEARAMLACDYCNDWFHYECVGLRAPQEDEDDQEVAPRDFRCPECCMKINVPYPAMSKLPVQSRHRLKSVYDKMKPQLEARVQQQVQQRVQPQAVGPMQQQAAQAQAHVQAPVLQPPRMAPPMLMTGYAMPAMPSGSSHPQLMQPATVQMALPSASVPTSLPPRTGDLQTVILQALAQQTPQNMHFVRDVSNLASNGNTGTGAGVGDQQMLQGGHMIPTLGPGMQLQQGNYQIPMNMSGRGGQQGGMGGKGNPIYGYGQTAQGQMMASFVHMPGQGAPMGAHTQYPAAMLPAGVLGAQVMYPGQAMPMHSQAASVNHQAADDFNVQSFLNLPAMGQPGMSQPPPAQTMTLQDILKGQAAAQGPLVPSPLPAPASPAPTVVVSAPSNVGVGVGVVRAGKEAVGTAVPQPAAPGHDADTDPGNTFLNIDAAGLDDGGLLSAPAPLPDNTFEANFLAQTPRAASAAARDPTAGEADGGQFLNEAMLGGHSGPPSGGGATPDEAAGGQATTTTPVAVADGTAAAPQGNNASSNGENKGKSDVPVTDVAPAGVGGSAAQPAPESSAPEPATVAQPPSPARQPSPAPGPEPVIAAPPEAPDQTPEVDAEAEDPTAQFMQIDAFDGPSDEPVAVATIDTAAAATPTAAAPEKLADKPAHVADPMPALPPPQPTSQPPLAIPQPVDNVDVFLSDPAPFALHDTDQPVDIVTLAAQTAANDNGQVDLAGDFILDKPAE